ncbi:MAG TPA: hypothetical protein VGP80_01060 [Gemmatimonadales bacterium]|jgi:hypothetical protein|nr:hypothetical protein [Gemmatimonadales bacterium]
MYLLSFAALILAPHAPPPQDWLQSVLNAMQLPVVAAEARDAGVADVDVRGILDRIRRNRLPAEDAWRVLDEEVRVVRAGGPRENFGAFVQTQLDAGLRGQALAEAIRQEHARRGIGRPDAGEDRDGAGNRPGDDKDRVVNDHQRDNPPAVRRDSSRKERKP